MKTNTIHIYTDASFAGQNQFAVAGLLVFENDESHVAQKSEQPVQIKMFKEKSNIRAELRGVINALDSMAKKLKKTNAKDQKIILYTDCKSIVDLPGRRQRLEASDFVAKRSKKTVSNADLYKQFYKLCDKVNPTLIWVKGHSSKTDRDLIEKKFSIVDKTVRKALRKMIIRFVCPPSHARRAMADE